MTAADLLARLDGPRRTARGWTARCPAHHDRSPSLSISEGTRGVLLYCHAGCTLDEICAAIGLTTRDLFFGDYAHHASPCVRDEPLEYRVWAAAQALTLRALGVLDAAVGLDTTTWTDADFDAAMTAVGRARADLRRAEALDTLAFAMREKALHAQS